MATSAKDYLDRRRKKITMVVAEVELLIESECDELGVQPMKKPHS